MKILFFSDIHGIKDNLIYIEKLLNEEDFDKIVVLGDLYYSGPNYDNKLEINSRLVKEFLTNYKEKVIVLRGNCDSDVDLKASDFPISNLCLITVDNIDIYCTHGNEYSYDKKDKFYQKGILVYGHEHIPYIKTLNQMTYICVGSISLPKNGSKSSYMIYENKSFTIYDINRNIIDSVKIK